MSSAGSKQDVPFVLFVVPFVVSGLYALYLWGASGLSAFLPSTVFLQVTESPYVFLVGFLAVMAGAATDVLLAEPSKRRAKLIEESSTLQKIAATALVLGALCAWYASGFDLGAASSAFVSGRYVIIFPALLILFSFLILPSVTVTRTQARSVVIGLLLLGVPLSIDEIGKRNFYAGMAVGLALLAFALYLYLGGPRRASRSA